MIIPCLLCNEEVTQRLSWTSFLLLNEQYACDQCFQTLKLIFSPTCPSCYRPQENETLCSDCQRWQEDPLWKNVLQKNVSVFKYNDAMKEVLATFKFRGDAALVNVFKQSFVQRYKSHYVENKTDYILPIPLSEERLYERGFNQAKLLSDFLPLPQLDALQRTHHEKQSKKSRNERLSSANVFSITDSSKIENKHILLVDDIYTTGSTLRHAAKLLIEHGASTVCALTLIRS